MIFRVSALLLEHNHAEYAFLDHDQACSVSQNHTSDVLVLAADESLVHFPGLLQHGRFGRFVKAVDLEVLLPVKGPPDPRLSGLGLVFFGLLGLVRLVEGLSPLGLESLGGCIHRLVSLQTSQVLHHLRNIKSNVVITSHIMVFSV